jgi:hypothetical protein
MPLSDAFGVHVRGKLLGDLRLGEPHHLGGLHRGDRRARPLQPVQSVDPIRIANKAAVGHRCRKLGEQVIHPRHHRIARERLDHPQDCHARNATAHH